MYVCFQIYFSADSEDIPKPEILAKPDSQIKEGTKLEIECKTKGTFAKLSWEKEGRKVCT